MFSCIFDNCIYCGNRTKKPSGQNPPPVKKKTLWPKPPSDKKPPPAKKKKTLVNPPPLLPLLSNEYYESYKPTTLINCKLPN